MGVEKYDWNEWETNKPQHVTLIFPVRPITREILLIEKLTGIGKGKINGAGGKVEVSETPSQCAVREIAEELMIQVVGDVKKVGECHFLGINDKLPNMMCHIFFCLEWEGTATATREASPRWTSFDNIPYKEMWPDDKLWMPRLIDIAMAESVGKKKLPNGFLFRGVFDGDVMLEDEMSYPFTISSVS